MNKMSDKTPSGVAFDDLLGGDAKPPKPQISLREFWTAYRSQWRWLLKALAIVLPVTFFAVPLCMHLFGGPSYTAEMTVAPNRMVAGAEGNGGGLSSLIGLQGPIDTQFELYLSTRKSHLLAERMMAMPGVPQRIFSAFWDPEAKEWRPSSGLIPRMKRAINGALGFTPWAPPNAGDLSEYLSTAFTVESNRRTLITKITFSDADPDFAKWLTLIVHDQAEAILREQAQQRTRIMIAHAVHELQIVTVAEQRLALIQLLSQQEKQLMMIDKNLPYASVVVDPPSADRPDNAPRPLRNIFVALVLVTILAAAALAARVLRDIKRKMAVKIEATPPVAPARRARPQGA